MEFNQPQSIFRQLAERLCDRIASGEWSPQERIPSIREMAISWGVNPNTVTRSYQHLMQEGLIENRRGIGYFVAQDATKKIYQDMKKKFLESELPRMFHQMQYLGISEEELVLSYKNFKKENST